MGGVSVRRARRDFSPRDLQRRFHVDHTADAARELDGPLAIGFRRDGAREGHHARLNGDIDSLGTHRGIVDERGLDLCRQRGGVDGLAHVGRAAGRGNQDGEADEQRASLRRP
jgi:hypothetical protein